MMVNWWPKGLRLAVLGAVLLFVLTGCAVPQVKAEDRLFIPIAVQVLDEYRLPQETFQETTVGGLSAITYDRQTNQFFALSDDRGGTSPARFYTLAMEFVLDQSTQPKFDTVQVESVTTLKDAEGNPYPAGGLDPEGLALSPRNTLFISSEGDVQQDIPPFIGEFSRETGQIKTVFRVPDRFLPDDDESPTKGVRNNLSFESLTATGNPGADGLIEPIRLFTVTESSLVQDYNEDPSQPLNSRFLHYLIGNDQSTLIAEHLYPLDLEPTGALLNGVSEMLVLDRNGHFLSLERAFGLRGFRVRLYQLATGGATDTSAMVTLKSALEGVSPIRKRLVLDFVETSYEVDNLEGMTLGPRLPDGSQSLILVSDNNFQANQDTRFLLLRLQM
jgi:hypothetical protein